MAELPTLFACLAVSESVGLQSHSLDLTQIQIPLSGWLTRSCTDPGASCWVGYMTEPEKNNKLEKYTTTGHF